MSGNVEEEGFLLVSRSEHTRLIVCPLSHIYVHYKMDKKKRLVELLCMEEVSIPACYMIFGHRCLQNGGFGWQVSHRLRSHTYLIPSR